MEIVILDDAEAIGRLAADEICALLRRKPDAVLGLATGSSPLSIYDQLAARYAAGEVTFASARAFTLDEYVGLAGRPPAALPQRHRDGVRLARRHPAGRRPRPRRPGRGHPGRLRAPTSGPSRTAGGVDLQILGIGTDGHIALQRARLLAGLPHADQDAHPADPARQRPVLRRRPRRRTRPTASPRGWRRSCPPGTSSSSRPARARRRRCTELAEGAVSALWPATVLQHHPHVSVLLDEPPRAGCSSPAYYRETYSGKPAWQGL